MSGIIVSSYATKQSKNQKNEFQSALLKLDLKSLVHLLVTLQSNKISMLKYNIDKCKIYLQMLFIPPHVIFF